MAGKSGDSYFAFCASAKALSRSLPSSASTQARFAFATGKFGSASSAWAKYFRAVARSFSAGTHSPRERSGLPISAARRALFDIVRGLHPFGPDFDKFRPNVNTQEHSWDRLELRVQAAPEPHSYLWSQIRACPAARGLENE